MPNRTLFFIRIALISGVAMFAALATWQRARGMPAPTLGPDQLTTLRYALWALAAAAVGAAFFLRGRMDSASVQQRRSMTIVGWAFGEGVALFGVVQHFIGGPTSTMALGLLTFAVALLLLPVPREAR